MSLSHEDLLREMHGDVRVIKEQVENLVKHQDRVSTRLVPIEDDYKVRKAIYKLLVGGVGLFVGLLSILSYLKKI